MIFEVTVLFLVSLVILGTFLVLAEWRFVFYPSPHPEGFWEPVGLGEQFYDEYFESDDGLTLHGWWAPSEESNKTLLWFHGNSGNITNRIKDFKLYIELGLQVFLFDYRGYGKSDGRPSEEGLYRDGFSAFDHIREEKDLGTEDVYLLGRSLGGAVATRVAKDVEAAGLILQSPFTNIKDMAWDSLPVPVLPDLMKIRLDSLERIQDVDKPLLIFHGNRDEIVPIQLGRKLFEQASEPKWFVEIEGAGHDYISEIGGEKYRQSLLNFIHHGSPEIEKKGDVKEKE